MQILDLIIEQKKAGGVKAYWDRVNSKKPKVRSRQYPKKSIRKQRRKPACFRGKSGYARYLKTTHWKNLRANFLAENPFCICGRRATQVHHRSYKNLGKERANQLVGVCWSCHSAIHRLVLNSTIKLKDADSVYRSLLKIGIEGEV